ncbi:MAG: hypothetical protein ACI9FR_000891 [Cryomorphaceae bacterium]|jgi:hypothetical protein
MKLKQKLIVSVIIVACLVLAQLKLVDGYGIKRTEEGLQRALVTYGISRGLNAVISVVQGTEIAIEPVGVGMTFTPGQILDPVNDLIERFSTVVLVSGTAFGIQRVFLDLLASSAFSIVLLLLVLTALLLVWFGRPVQPAVRQAIFKAAAILLIVRFSVPMVAVASEQFYQTFLSPQFEASSAQLVSTTDRLEEIQAKKAAPESAQVEQQKSFYESAKALFQSASSTLDMQQHLRDFKTATEDISEHAIRLIVIFIFQTIILPLGFLWLVLRVLKWIAGRNWMTLS